MHVIEDLNEEIFLEHIMKKRQKVNQAEFRVEKKSRKKTVNYM